MKISFRFLIEKLHETKITATRFSLNYIMLYLTNKKQPYLATVGSKQNKLKNFAGYIELCACMSKCIICFK